MPGESARAKAQFLWAIPSQSANDTPSALVSPPLEAVFSAQMPAGFGTATARKYLKAKCGPEACCDSVDAIMLRVPLIVPASAFPTDEAARVLLDQVAIAVATEAKVHFILAMPGESPQEKAQFIKDMPGESTEAKARFISAVPGSSTKAKAHFIYTMPGNSPQEKAKFICEMMMC
jgi:hypothetical protein